MSAWDGMNRRKFPRVSYPCLIVLKYEPGENESILTHTENIGIGGISVIAKKGIKAFSQVDLELDILDMGNHIKCKGKVVWSIRRKEDESKKPLFYDIGIEYVDISAADRERLEVVIKRLAKEGHAIPDWNG